MYVKHLAQGPAQRKGPASLQYRSIELCNETGYPQSNTVATSHMFVGIEHFKCRSAFEELNFLLKFNQLKCKFKYPWC